MEYNAGVLSLASDCMTDNDPTQLYLSDLVSHCLEDQQTQQLTP